MKNFTYRSSAKKIKKIPRKIAGATLLITIVMSGLLLGIVLGLSKVVADEVQFAGEVTRGERAYFAAESGVERSLLQLRTDPVLHTEFVITSETFRKAENQTIINNLVGETEATLINLKPLESQKMRLRTNESGVISTVAIPNIKISAEISDGVVDEVLQWQILCNQENRILSIQALTGEIRNNDFGNLTGTVDYFDDEVGDFAAQANVSVDQFWRRFANPDQVRQQCFLSVKNLADTDLVVTLSGTQFAPPTGKIRSLGKSGDQQKIIEFQYSQKALAPVFDFGILVTE